MKINVSYLSNTLLPACITDILEETKNSILELCREPDKVEILFGAMRKNLVNWIAYHAEIEN